MGKEAWYLKNVNKKGQIGSKIKFKREVDTILSQKFKDTWEYHKGQYRINATDITQAEPYIAQYKLEDWYADTSSANIDKLCKPNLSGRRFTGVFKRKL